MMRNNGIVEVKERPPDILTLEEAADFLRISKSKMYSMVYQKQLPVKRVGGNYRFSRKRLEQWIEEG